MANSSSANDTIDGTPLTYSGMLNFVEQVVAFTKRGGIDHVNPKRVRNNDGEPVTSAGTSTEGDTNLCVVCFKNHKNYSFVHDDYIHFCVCKSCAFRIAIKNMQCPICNIRALKVLQTYE